MKITNYFIAILFFAMAFVSCNQNSLFLDETTTPTLDQATLNQTSTDLAAPVYCGSKTYTLWSGGTVDVGTETVANDGTNLYVTFTTTGLFGKLSVWAGTDSTLYPTPIPGNAPQPDLFPYQADFTTTGGVNTYTFVIPLANIPFYAKCGDKIYVLAHAMVKIFGNYGPAWGGDLKITGKPIFYSRYATGCCEVTPPPPPTELMGTAFAKGGWVFTTDTKSNPEKLPSLKLTKNRWGWAINLKQAGIITYDMWVGAGLNNTSKGKKVGTVTINYTGTQATVTYNLLSGYAIEEGHIYAGDFVPTTLAPGQYGNTFYYIPFATTFSTTIDVTDTNGDGVWFIVHSIVYGPGVSNI